MYKLAVIGISDFPSRKGGYDTFVMDLVSYPSSKIHYFIFTETDKINASVEQYANYTKIPVFRKKSMLGLIQHRIHSYEIAEKMGITNIYFLSYVAIPMLLFKKIKMNLITNMDGLEWKRSEYSCFKRAYLKFAEWSAIAKSKILIADSISISKYIKKQYKKESIFIPYAVNDDIIFNEEEIKFTLAKYSVQENNFYLIVARCVKENHLLEMLEGFCKSSTQKHLIVATDNRKNLLREKINILMEGDPRIKYMNPIYDKKELEILRTKCYCYMHGHSVGGTNPSLLESLTKASQIIAHDNPFNREVLSETGVYFKTSKDITQILDNEKSLILSSEESNKRKISADNIYNMDNIFNSTLKVLK